MFKAALMIAALTAAAHATPPANTSRVRVDGIALQMTSAQVVALAHHRGERVRVIRGACLADYLSDGQRVQALENRHGHCVESIWMKFAGGDLLIFFKEDLPQRPNVSVVSEIALNYPKDEKPVNSIEQIAGNPTLTDGGKPWAVAFWCFGRPCKTMDRVLNDPQAPPFLIVHTGAGLSLIDRPIETRSDAFVAKSLREKGIRLEH